MWYQLSSQHFQVMVPPRFGGHMIGLCGDCDGRPDDLKVRGGGSVKHLKNKYKLLSDSFAVDETDDNMLRG